MTFMDLVVFALPYPSFCMVNIMARRKLRSTMNWDLERIGESFVNIKDAFLMSPVVGVSIAYAIWSIRSTLLAFVIRIMSFK
jgi:hypothetical protein